MDDFKTDNFFSLYHSDISYGQFYHPSPPQVSQRGAQRDKQNLVFYSANFMDFMEFYGMMCEVGMEKLTS